MSQDGLLETTFGYFESSIQTLSSASLQAGSASLEIEALLGQGSSANVYLARHRKLHGQEGASNGKRIILKVLKNSAEKNRPDLEKEVRAMHALQRHPNIVGYDGLTWVEEGIDDDQIRLPCLAMQLEYCKGGDLHDKVSHKRFEESEALLVVQAILNGLSHIHALGFVHRDMKPENILWADGAVKIADFGICCHTSDEQEMKRSCGSPGYIAPEIILGRVYGSKVDCFSVGTITYFIVSGRHAFVGHDIISSMKKTVRRPLDFRRSLCLEILSEGCKQFMLELTGKDPQCRPTSEEALQNQWMSQGRSFLQTNNFKEAMPINRGVANASTPVVRDSIAQTRPERHDYCSRMSKRRSGDTDRSDRLSCDSSTVAWTTHRTLSKATSSVCDRRTFQSEENEDILSEMPHEPTRPDGPSVKKKVPFCLLARRSANFRNIPGRL
jgi:calcium/calmodulin-dependent protein kinase I